MLYIVLGTARNAVAIFYYYQTLLFFALLLVAVNIVACGQFNNKSLA